MKCEYMGLTCDDLRVQMQLNGKNRYKGIEILRFNILNPVTENWSVEDEICKVNA